MMEIRPSTIFHSYHIIGKIYHLGEELEPEKFLWAEKDVHESTIITGLGSRLAVDI